MKEEGEPEGGKTDRKGRRQQQRGPALLAQQICWLLVLHIQNRQNLLMSYISGLKVICYRRRGRAGTGGLVILHSIVGF